MSSRHLLDPELVAGLEALPVFPEFTAESLPQIRALMQEFAKLQLELPPVDGIAISEERIPGPPGAPSVRVVIYRPAKADNPLPVFLHIHGGGLILGTPELNHASSINIANSYQAVVISVDYRLAPETPFPGSIEDCFAALQWMTANTKTLGIDTKRIVIGGESAGGGLAAALAILARDRGAAPIACQMLVYPMLDDRSGTTYEHPHVGEFVWTRANNDYGWRSYLGRAPGGKDVSPYASAARCEDLRGLPPAFIATGALDLFLEEDMDYARRLIRAGVPTELHVYPGSFHAFDIIVDAPVAQAFRRDYANALQKAFAARGS
jgi:acetyl esterase/lipase